MTSAPRCQQRVEKASDGSEAEVRLQDGGVLIADFRLQISDLQFQILISD
jgi:hypothetical protein